MDVITKISPQRIADLFVGAIEGGSTYWCRQVLLVTSGGATITEKPWYADPALYADDEFIITVVEDEASEEGKSPRHAIGPADIAKGLKVMAEKYPAHFADIVGENDDANTADLFLQCVALGDEVYA